MKNDRQLVLVREEKKHWQCAVLQVRGAEVHRAAHAHLQHQVRHPAVGARHRLEPPRHLDVQIILSQVSDPV